MLVDWERQGGLSARAPNADKLPFSARYEGWRLYLRVVGYGFGMLLAVVSGYSASTQGESRLMGAAFSLIVLSYCAAQLWRLRRPLVIVYPDRLEKPGLFGSAVLYRASVKGVGEVVSTRYGSYFDVVSSSPTEPCLRLDGFLRKHPILSDWLHGAPDPAAEAVKADRANILADSRYGATWEERERLLKLAKIAAVTFNVVCVGLAVWLWFGVDLDRLALMIAFAPVLAAFGIVAVSKGLLGWPYKETARPTVVGAFAPTLTLAAKEAF